MSAGRLVGELCASAQLLQHGFTVDQVVHDYGDLCQAITKLAVDRGAAIQVEEFRTLNRCLDNAIADAVTELPSNAIFRCGRARSDVERASRLFCA